MSSCEMVCLSIYWKDIACCVNVVNHGICGLVLFSIQSLALIALLLHSMVDVNSLIKKWTLWMPRVCNQSDDADLLNETIVLATETNESQSDSAFSRFGKFFVHMTRKVPYVNTAAAMNPGLLFYSTVSCFCAAYIFLPSSDSDESFHDIENTTDRKQIDRYVSQDKRHIVTLSRKTHTWRVFPLAVKKVNLLSSPRNALNTDVSSHLSQTRIELEGKQAYAKLAGNHDPFGTYTPVFCLETACWLMECSWQAYYSPDGEVNDLWSSGKQNLGSIGLKLDSYVCNKDTDTWAYVCSNTHDQVDGKEDSIIVVTFRGTASTTNLVNDLKFR